LNSVALISYSGNTGSGNGINGFAVTGAVNGDHTWLTPVPCPFPFVVLNGDVTVAESHRLTISPGAVVKFQSETAHIKVDGTLDAIGTAGNRIVFTSLNLVRYLWSLLFRSV